MAEKDLIPHLNQSSRPAPHAKAVVILGPPGSGKTTLIRRLARRPGFVRAETGEILRAESIQESGRGREVRQMLETDGMVRGELVAELLIEWLWGIQTPAALLDGFPRTKDQATHLEKICDESRRELSAIVRLHLTREQAVARISARRRCPQCYAAYHPDVNPPVRADRCDQCKIPLVQDPCDSPEVVERQYQLFERDEIPAIEYLCAVFPERVFNINANQKPADLFREAGDTIREALANAQTQGGNM